MIWTRRESKGDSGAEVKDDVTMHASDWSAYSSSHVTAPLGSSSGIAQLRTIPSTAFL